MGIVWVSQPANSSVPRPNYHLLHWRNPHINGVRFAELNSYDIHGLSAIISRTVPHNMIHYILGATGEGRQQLHLHPGAHLSYIDYVFIENDEDVRAWLLSNPVLDDPLDLLVYCHRRDTRGRLPTPPMRGHNYLRENAIANWVSTAAPGNRIQVARSDGRTDPGPSCNMCTCSGNGTQERAVQELLCLVDFIFGLFDLISAPPLPVSQIGYAIVLLCLLCWKFIFRIPGMEWSCNTGEG